MKDFLKNYISWKKTDATVEQKLRRLHELEEVIGFLFKKMYCSLIRRETWKKIVDKNLKLTIEYIDLIQCLYEDENIGDFLNNIEEKMKIIKQQSGYCLRCFEREIEYICVCDPCPFCGRIELCFC